MSTDQHPPVVVSPAAPPRKRRWVRVLVGALVVVVVFLIGVATGDSGASKRAAENPVTPQSCLDALDATALAFSIAADSVREAAAFDQVGLDASGAQIRALLPPFRKAATDCRAHAAAK